MSCPRAAIARLTLALACLSATPVASAQQRPLTTEDPETIGAGRILVEAGVETGQNAEYPLSGLRGDRIAMPLGISVGLGSIGELQLDSGYTWFGIDSRVDAPLSSRVPPDVDRTSDLIDLVVATKVRLVSEGPRRPAVGVRFATRLPNASTGVLAGKTVGSLRVVANAGVAILSHPLVGTIQDDAFVGSVSIARALTKELELVGEVAGQVVLFADVAPVGAEPLGEGRAAVRYTRGRTRVDGGILIGFTRRSPDFGIMAGVTIIGQAGKP